MVLQLDSNVQKARRSKYHLGKHGRDEQFVAPASAGHCVVRSVLYGEIRCNICRVIGSALVFDFGLVE